jgi:hypothetical protein
MGKLHVVALLIGFCKKMNVQFAGQIHIVSHV